MITHKEVKDFWKELKREEQERFFTKPDLCLGDEVTYEIQTKKNFILSNVFWDIFRKYPFHIYRVEHGNVCVLQFRVEKGDQK